MGSKSSSLNGSESPMVNLPSTSKELALFLTLIAFVPGTFASLKTLNGSALPKLAAITDAWPGLSNDTN